LYLNTVNTYLLHSVYGYPSPYTLFLVL